MRVISEKTLALFRGSGRCENCRGLFSHRHAAHVFARGIGGGGRIDHPWNLVSLCALCHRDSHEGRSPSRNDLIALVARREQMTFAEVLAELLRLRRADKYGNEPVRRMP